VNWEVWRGCRGGGVHVKNVTFGWIPIKLTEIPIFLVYFCCCFYIFWSLCAGQTAISTTAVSHPLPAAAAVTSHGDVELKPAITSLSSSNGMSTTSTPLVASLMLHPSANSFQLVSTIPAAHLPAAGPSRAAATPLQYIVPPLALSDTAGKIMQMVSTGVQASSQSAAQQLAGFQVATFPGAAVQLGGRPQLFMLCPQSQAQHQQSMQTSALSSVVPVVVAAGTSQQLAMSKYVPPNICDAWRYLYTVFCGAVNSDLT